jgi:hypothetical protein
MKKLLLLPAMVAFGHSVVFTQGCLPEGITFTTQEQIDNFQINYPGCTEIEGNVQIGVVPGYLNITNLSGLSVVTSINGDLFFNCNYGLTSLAGLENLTSIGGSLKIFANHALNNLVGLEGLTFVGGDLSIHPNSAMINLQGLDNLTSIGGNLEIFDNNALTSLMGLENVTSILGGLSISSNPALTSLSILSNLTYIGGGLYIGYNHGLTSLTGLEGLTSIGENLGIVDNYSLTSLIGLDNISSIGGSLLIYYYTGYNNALISLTGLEGLTSIGGELAIIGTETLTSLTGLEGLTSVGEGLGLVILDNTALIDLTGLDNLTSIGGNLIIGNDDFGGNPSLTCLTGVEGLTSIGGFLLIYGNAVLTSLTGLDNIDAGSIDSLYIYENSSLFTCEMPSICNYLAMPNGSVNIHNNAIGCNSAIEVSNVCGVTSPCLPYGNYYFSSQADIDNFQTIYPNCTELEGNMTISGNDITDLNELNVVTSIAGDLSIHSNSGLTSLAELDNVTSIGGILYINDNNALTSLSGLDNIDAGSINNLLISNNDTLSTCEVQSVCDYLTSPNGYIYITNNAPGCDNREEVEAVCEAISVENLTIDSEFLCYPNPSSNQITIETSRIPHQSNLIIINVDGQKLINRHITEQKTVIDLSKLPGGVYFVRLTGEREFEVAKILKD